MANVYLFGMIVYSTIHRLAGDYPEADGYGEIEQTFRVPGGETGNSALALAHWGHRVTVEGPHLGSETRAGVLSFLNSRGIDCSLLKYRRSFHGLEDTVIVGGQTRTVFGRFGGYFRGPRLWARPTPRAVAKADIVGLDPFFAKESEQVATLAAKHGKPLVTIDCPPGGGIHRAAAATIVSGEYRRNHHPAVRARALIRRYSDSGPGLIVFTQGSGPILFCRGSGPVLSERPVAARILSTLGAGDTFRAGVMQGMLLGYSDREIVRFAAATSAAVCSRFPFALDPPGMAEIQALRRRTR